MRISFIGSGNVATHLAQAFHKAGHQITQVFSRNKEHTQHLAQSIYAKPIVSLEEIDTNVDFYFICVPDQHISNISSELPKHIPQVHTSGNTMLSELKGHITGVFYPLQTFSKEKSIDYSTLNILLESEDKNMLNNLSELATSIHSTIHYVNSTERQKLHVAAVFACNFSNLMVHISEDILSENKLDPKLLLPLIEETTNKLKTMSAKQAQTGPALRGDSNTINTHKTILKQFSPSVQNIYEVLTQEIKKRHGKL